MKRYLAMAVFAAFVILGIQPSLLKMPWQRREVGAVLAREADRQWYPSYPQFLEGVRAHTKPGDVIALVVPARRWHDGYEYAYYRASYFLAGRDVVPILDRENRLQDTRHVRYVASFRVPVRGEVVWQNENGMLVRVR